MEWSLIFDWCLFFLNLRFLSNKYLLKPGVGQDSKVEWGYCFDVHLNALFPLLVLLHLVMILLYHGKVFVELFILFNVGYNIIYLPSFWTFFTAVIGHDWTISMVLGNTLWLAALGYYNYITFLGYSCLPQLKSTRIYRTLFLLLALLYILTLLCGWNLSTTLINFYQNRVL